VDGVWRRNDSHWPGASLMHRYHAAVIVWTVLLWSGQSFEDQGALHAAFPWLLDGCFNATITGVVWPFLASVSATGITFAVEPDNRRAAVWRIIVRTIGVAAAIIALSPWLVGLPAVCTY
jgi:hypothetical protein